MTSGYVASCWRWLERRGLLRPDTTLACDEVAPCWPSLEGLVGSSNMRFIFFAEQAHEWRCPCQALSVIGWRHVLQALHTDWLVL